MDTEDKNSNYSLFRECFSSALLERVARPEKKKPRRRAGRKNSVAAAENPEDENIQTNQEELGEFIEFLASEIFPSLPQALQDLSHKDAETSPSTASQWTSLTQTDVEETILPVLPGTVSESVSTYGVLPGSTSLAGLLADALGSYAAAVTGPAPAWAATRAAECEICGRDWIPLTYHHLIPRAVHDKALRRAWHDRRDLNRVAWLCRACHSFVHRAADNETLARSFHTVDLLMERADVQDWAKWVARVRWKAR